MSPNRDSSIGISRIPVPKSGIKRSTQADPLVGLNGATVNNSPHTYSHSPNSVPRAAGAWTENSDVVLNRGNRVNRGQTVLSFETPYKAFERQDQMDSVKRQSMARKGANESPATSLGRMSLSNSQQLPHSSLLTTPVSKRATATNSLQAAAAPKKNRLSAYGVPVNEASTSQANRRDRRLTMMAADGRKRIVVAVRKRPLSHIECSKGDGNSCITVSADSGAISLRVLRTKLDGMTKYAEDFSFSFDRAYDEDVTNQRVFGEIVQPLISFALSGGKATCFAYGQTGSGKTHTMFNAVDGICFMAAVDLIRRDEGRFKYCIGFFEIYQGQLYDLLKIRRKVVPCEKADGQVKIMGLTEHYVTTPEEAIEVIQQGLSTRMTGKTGANSQSSRSHAILQISLMPRTSTSKEPSAFGRISFIDLAGSERGADRANVDKRTKMEGSEINKSLLALKECIRAIDQDAAHLPFRQSKLTLVLKDSIVGNVRTAMIAAVSPAPSSSEHTLNTLRYAERFHEIGGPGASLVSFESQDVIMPLLPSKADCISAAVDWTIADVPRPVVAPPALSVKTAANSAATLSNKNTPITPIRTVTFDVLDERVVEVRNFVLSQLCSLQNQVVGCRDVDILELLSEELSTLTHAFRSLA